MTEKKKLPEQKALYHYRAGSREPKLSHPVRKREESRPASRSARSESVHSLQRVVTIPQSDPSVAWDTFAQRQMRLRHARVGSPRRQIQSVPRTLAQTGMPASIGSIGYTRRRLPYYRSSAIPARSGHLHARRGLLWKLLGLFSIGVILICAMSFAFTSNTFRVEHVTIVGTHNTTLVQSIQRMGVQGQNIFLLNVVALRERITASSFVSSVDLNRQLPDQLTVTVVERSPVLLWQTPQGTYSVDSQGVIIASAARLAGSDHLGKVIDVTKQGKGDAAQVLQPGAHLDQHTIAFAQAVLRGMPAVIGGGAFTLRYDGAMFANNLNQLGTKSDSRGSYIIESADGWKAYLGGVYDDNPLDNRLKELREILNLAQKQQLTVATIDLRYGLRPVFTLQK